MNPRKVWEGIKELRDFRYTARANRCIWYPSSKKLRMDRMKVSKMIEVQALLPSWFKY